MSTIEKLKQELKTRPRIFGWDDLVHVLTSVGYAKKTAGKTSGSRFRFTHKTAASLLLHKPHPGNQVKKYLIDFVVDTLEKEGLL